MCLFLFQKHKRKSHCDKNNYSTGNLADLSSNEDEINIIDGDFKKLQVDKPYQIKYSEIYGRFGMFFIFIFFFVNYDLKLRSFFAALIKQMIISYCYEN